MARRSPRVYMVMQHYHGLQGDKVLETARDQLGLREENRENA